MRDPFSLMDVSNSRGGLSGMIDYWIAVSVAGGNVTVTDRAGETTIGVALRVSGGGVVVYTDRHGIARSDTFSDGETLPTSVASITQAGTTATGIRVAIAP